MSARRSFAALAIALAALIALPRAIAGTIYLLNGEEIDGDIVGCDAEEVTLKFRFGQQRINLREVRDVEFGPGESLWEGQVRRALEASRKRAQEESARKLAEKLAAQGLKPPAARTEPAPAVERPTYIPPPIAPPDLAEKRTYRGTFESTEWGFTIHYPAGWTAKEEDKDFFTFRDPRDTVRAVWSFDVTAISDFDADLPSIVERATKELDALGARYHVRARRAVKIGHYEAQRTIGLFEKDGRAVRHDQVIVRVRRGILVIHFFSPGALLDDGGAPDVEGVLASMELK